VEVVREGNGLLFRANGMDLADVMVESPSPKHQVK
jgi:hypothetical protein